MSTAPYIPREGSVALKVISFLRQNPEEQLDADIISAKFDCSRASVHTLLREAIGAGYIDRNEDLTSGELVYTVGKVPLPSQKGFHGWLEAKGLQSAEGRAASAPRTVAPTPPPAPEAKADKPRATAFRMDLSSITIQDDVPIQVAKTPRLDWTPLFDRLQVGNSFELPKEARSAVAVAATAYKRATNKALSIRTTPNGLRVWRVE